MAINCKKKIINMLSGLSYLGYLAAFRSPYPIVVMVVVMKYI